MNKEQLKKIIYDFNDNKYYLDAKDNFINGLVDYSIVDEKDYYDKANKLLEESIKNPENLDDIIKKAWGSNDDTSYTYINEDNKKIFSNLAIACMGYIVARLKYYNDHKTEKKQPKLDEIKENIQKELKTFLSDKKVTKNLFSLADRDNPITEMLKVLSRKLKKLKMTKYEKNILGKYINTSIKELEKLKKAAENKQANEMTNAFSGEHFQFIRDFILKTFNQKVDNNRKLFTGETSEEKPDNFNEEEINNLKKIRLNHMAFKKNVEDITVPEDKIRIKDTTTTTTDIFVDFPKSSKVKYENDLIGIRLKEKLNSLAANYPNMNLYDALNKLLQSPEQFSLRAGYFVDIITPPPPNKPEFKDSISKLAVAYMNYIKIGESIGINKDKDNIALFFSTVFQNKEALKEIILASLTYEPPFKSMDLSSAAILKILRKYIAKTNENKLFLEALNEKIDKWTKKEEILGEIERLTQKKKENELFQKDIEHGSRITHVTHVAKEFAAWYAKNADNILDTEGKKKFDYFKKAVGKIKAGTLKNRFFKLLNNIARFFGIKLHIDIPKDWYGPKNKLEIFFPDEKITEESGPLVIK